MENQVKETGTERLKRLREQAGKLGIKGRFTADEFEAKIKEVLSEPVVIPSKGVTHDEAVKIDAKLKYEEESRIKIRRQIEIVKERATILAESETLKIKIDLPENPTELQLAKARLALGMKKVEFKPSPETLAIEASERAYYIFTNPEQEDAAHKVNPGGKYYINLIPDHVHVLSKWHIKFFRQKAVRPVYTRVETGAVTDGQMGAECKRTASKPRFAFEYLDDAPKDASFGLVLDPEILDKVRPKEELLI